MAKIDTSEWKEFVIGDLFEQLKLKCLKEDFNKAMDVSEIRTEEFNLPLINAKKGSNGIMYYGRKSDFEYAKMTIDIVQNGAISTGSVYAQPQETGVLWDAYLIQPKTGVSELVLLFLATVIEKTIKEKYSYDDKCTWDKVKSEAIQLPDDSHGQPDWAFMDRFMENTMKRSKASLSDLRLSYKEKKSVSLAGWSEFKIGELFEINRPIARSQAKYSEGDIPFVASGSFNNGIVKLCEPKENEVLDEGNCITVSPLDGSAFYQPQDFLGRGGAGSAIIILRNENLKIMSGLFISAIIRSSLTKYSYSDQLNTQSILSESIKLPVATHGLPDWNYMDRYMAKIIDERTIALECLQA